jgi:hypothetical protein
VSVRALRVRNLLRFSRLTRSARRDTEETLIVENVSGSRGIKPIPASTFRVSLKPLCKICKTPPAPHHQNRTYSVARVQNLQKSALVLCLAHPAASAPIPAGSVSKWCSPIPPSAFRVSSLAPLQNSQKSPAAPRHQNRIYSVARVQRLQNSMLPCSSAASDPSRREACQNGALPFRVPPSAFRVSSVARVQNLQKSLLLLPPRAVAAGVVQGSNTRLIS